MRPADLRFRQKLSDETGLPLSEAWRWYVNQHRYASDERHARTKRLDKNRKAFARAKAKVKAKRLTSQTENTLNASAGAPPFQHPNARARP